MSNVLPFNPLDKQNLGSSVADALSRAERVPLAAVPPFAGCGVYALYYCGDFSAYSAVAKRGELQWPIYVGKAVPEGARKGGVLDPATSSKALYRRLQEHAQSIAATPSLRVQDFECRFLVVDDIWIPLGEALLIARHTPVWNSLVDGFGNHDPGKGRYQGLRPRWDVLHPGRAWALRCAERSETAATITREVETFLRDVAPGN
jgi:hypothetical protein